VLTHFTERPWPCAPDNRLLDIAKPTGIYGYRRTFQRRRQNSQLHTRFHRACKGTYLTIQDCATNPCMQSHTGSNMALAMVDVLQKFGVEDKVSDARVR